MLINFFLLNSIQNLLVVFSEKLIKAGFNETEEKEFIVNPLIWESASSESNIHTPVVNFPNTFLKLKFKDVDNLNRLLIKN